MSLDASLFPEEGANFNSESMLPSVDYLMSHMPSVQRQVGAKPPVRLNRENLTTRMPGQNNTPDIPRKFNQPVAQQIRKQETTYVQPREAIANPYVVNSPIREENHKPVINFFKDMFGNQYKTVNSKLYFLGWQDSPLKIRLVNEKTGKEVNTDGKKFQVYGWHLVNKMDDEKEISKINKETDVTATADTINETTQHKTSVQHTEEKMVVVEQPIITSVTPNQEDVSVKPKKAKKKLI